MATTSHDKAANTAANAQTHLTPENGTVHLPQGIEVSACEMTREGSSLVLTAPDGQVFVIEGYFATLESPAIIGANGSILSPQLVQSFLTTAGDVQVAANNQISDQSPVGEVSETSGNATVTHADGTKEKITTGTQIFEGDVIETDAKGAVNIKFADDSTFAVSENARMSVDDFSFNPSDQSGTTGLSILRGVFMFTSGLVGRENPDAVHLNTPVGSIGIRGTIIGGHIGEDGNSQISVLEGAIVVRNGTGEQILSDQFATVQLTGFNAPISSIGTLDAGSISKSYGAVRSVSATLFTSIDDTANDTAKPDAKAPDAKGDAQPESQDTKPDAGKAEPAGDAQPQSQSQDIQSQDIQAQADTTAAAATEAAPLAETAATTVTSTAAASSTTTTVFQTLQTGSNIDSGLGAASAAPAPATTIATPTPVTVASAPAPVAPVQTTTQTAQTQTQQQFDTRPPSSATFVSGGAVAEESNAGTIVGTVGMSASLPFPVTYSLVSNPGNLFVINAATGVVTLAGTAGDSEQGITHHDLVVRITRTETSQFVDTPLSVGVLPVDEAPQFNSHTGINVTEGGTVTLTSALIGASDPEGGQLTYSVTAASKGQVLVQGATANSFTQTQLDAGLVTYAHNGSEPGGAGLQLTVADAAGNSAGTLDAIINVSPVNDAPISVVSTGGTLAENASATLAINNLNWTDSDNSPSEIVYNITSISNGSVEKLTPITISNLNGGQSSPSFMWLRKNVTETFTQQDINDGLIRFTQNGAESTNAGFSYTVSDGIATPQNGSYAYTVTPVNDAPTLVNNTTITVTEGQPIQINLSNLKYDDADNTPSQLTYIVSTTANGSVQKLVSNIWTNVTNFTQADINAGKIRFCHNGNEANNASFDYILQDTSGGSRPGKFNLSVTPVNDAPTLTRNQDLFVSEGGVTILDDSHLHYGDADNTSSQLTYIVSATAHGSVQKMVSNIWTNVTNFTQADINASKIRFSQNGDEANNASFDYTLRDPSGASQSGSFNLSVSPVNDAPTLTQNIVQNVTEGGVTLLHPSNLHYGDVDNNSSQLTYTVSSSSFGILEKQVSGAWTATTTFTQAEIDGGLVRFKHNGGEASTASFSYTVSDPSGAGDSGNFNFTVSPINDAPTGVSLTASTNFTERSGTVASTVVAQIAVVDAEPITDLLGSSFVVQSYKNNTWSTDTRFSTVFDGGQWVIKSDANQMFNYEGEPQIKLRVALTDAGVTINSPEAILNVVDVNETATAFKLNGDLKYSNSPIYDALVQGRTAGGIIGALNAIDPDTNTDFKPKAANYKVTATTGSALSVEDFEIVDVTNQNGLVTQVLKVKAGVTPIFPSTENPFTVTVVMDAAMSGFSDNDDITREFRFVGRNDTLTALSIGGNSGLRIDNNYFEGGAQFGTSITSADFNGDGKIDVAFGAPKALNYEATREAAGAVYSFNGTNGSFIKSLSTSGSDTGQMYGASIASLERFGTTKGAELAITNPGAGYVDIIHNGNSETVTKLTNIATGTAGAATTGKEITIASIGDINNDGFTDLLVGTPYNDASFTDKGQAYVVLGGINAGTFDITNLGSKGFLLPTNNLTAMANTNFGISATALGDFNGDGYADFAVGASGYTSSQTNAGAVSIYYGSADASTSYYSANNGMTILNTSSTSANGFYGSQVASAGDINHDGLSDLIARASGEANGGTLYVTMGQNNGGAMQIGLAPYQGFKITGNSNVLLNETFGSAGDFNGDGFDDIYVDTMTATASGLYQHTMVILYGGSLGSDINIADAMNDPYQSFKIRFLEPTGAHITATALGDYNGDGFDDIAIADPTANNAGSSLSDGRAFLVYGSNYDDIANRFTGDNTADTYGEYYVGSTGNNILNDGGHAELSFNGGAGNDAFVISKNDAIYTFNGGAGNDTIRLFFSEGETVTSPDQIDLVGIGSKVKGVETIEFASGSKNDTLVLDIKDILSMINTSDTRQLTLRALDNPATISANQNHLNITNGNENNISLSNYGFTNDYDQNGQSDRTNLWGSNDAYVYTNSATGAQLIVDSRLTSAETLAVVAL